jgi:hypothetical protein
MKIKPKQWFAMTLQERLMALYAQANRKLIIGRR